MQIEQDLQGRPPARRRPASRRAVRLRPTAVTAGPDEPAVAARALAACRAALAPGGSPTSLLADVRGALGASELIVLAEDRSQGDRLTMTASPGAPIPAHPAQLGQMEAIVRTGAGPEPASRLRPLLATLGVPDPGSATAFTLDEGGRRSTTIACWQDPNPLSPGWMGIVAAALTSTLGAIGDREKTAEAAARRDRAALAERLHDGPLQILAGSVLDLEAAAARLGQGPDEAAAVLGTSARRLREAASEFRAAIIGLVSGRREIDGDLRQQIEEAATRSSLPVRLSIEGDLHQVSRATISLAAAVVREAVANAGKHAGADAVAVRVSAGPEILVVAVRDRGRGFTPRDRERALARNHVGLALLERRVRDAGGSLRILSTPDMGTRVVARIPIDEVKP